jgi:hypothetical protein
MKRLLILPFCALFCLPVRGAVTSTTSVTNIVTVLLTNSTAPGLTTTGSVVAASFTTTGTVTAAGGFVGNGTGLTNLNAPTMPRIVLASNYYAVVGESMQLFTRGWLEHPYPYMFAPLVSIASGGSMFNRGWNWTPAAGNGNQSITCAVLTASCSLQEQATANVIVCTNNGPGITNYVMIIGDSEMEAQLWPSEFWRRLCGTNGSPSGCAYSNVQFIGTTPILSSQTNGGFSGHMVAHSGWLLDNFLNTNQNSVPQALWLTAAGNGKSSDDVNSYYQDSNGGVWTMVEVSGNYLKLFKTTGPYPQMLPAASGTLTWLSGYPRGTNGANISNITYTGTNYGVATPFWDPYQQVFSIPRFLATNNLPTPTHFYIELGINGMSLTTPGNPNDMTPQLSELNYMRTLVNAIHAWYPSAKVSIIGAFGTSPNNNFTASTPTSIRYDWYRTFVAFNSWNLNLSSIFLGSPYNSYCDFVPTQGLLDLENGYSYLMSPINNRGGIVTFSDADSLHATSGFYLLSDSLWRHYVCTYCK